MTYLLLVIYQIKHFICDYPLQGKYMLGKFKPGYAWILPLLAHALVHGIATAIIVLTFAGPGMLWLALLDMVVHFVIDRVKASPKLLGKYKPLTATTYPNATDEEKKSNVYFWWALGADQMAHHLTHYFIIWMLLK